MKNKFYTLQEINDITYTSVIYLKKLIKNVTLKTTRISKAYLVSEYDFYKFIELMEVKISDK